MILYSIDISEPAQAKFTKSKVITKRSFRSVAKGLFKLLDFEGLRALGRKTGLFGDLGRKKPHSRRLCAVWWPRKKVSP